MRSGWRDESEISEEEYMMYAYEYMAEHPFESGLVVKRFEAIFYDRIDGEFTVWRKIPGVHMYWQPGYFWAGIRISLHGIRQTRRENPSKVRLLAEYFGLVDPAYDD